MTAEPANRGRGRPPGPAPKFIVLPLNGLHERRKAKGLTLEQVGASIGINKAHMSKIERGEKRLDIHRAATIANLLGCAIGDLL